MARYAVVRDNIIRNLVEWNGGPQWSPPVGSTAELAPMACNIGWTWNGGNPINPNPPPAPPVDPREAARGLIARRIADLEKGDLAQQVESLRLRISLLEGL